MTTFVKLTAPEWGMVWERSPIVEHLSDPEIFVHHTAGGQHSPDGAEAFRRMNQSAINNRGYSAVAYDMLVHYNPDTDVCTIGEARGKWLSAATRDRNEQGEAICCIGYFHPGHKLSRRPYPAEIEGIARAIVWSIELGHSARDGKIMGHRENPAHPLDTVCPGDYLFAEMPTIRARVAELLDPEPAPGPTPTHQPPEDDVTEFLTFHPDPDRPRPGAHPVFATAGNTAVIWMSPEAYALHGSPTPRAVGLPAAKARVLLGGIGDPAHADAEAMFDRVVR